MNNIIYLSNPDKPSYVNTPESIAYQNIIHNKEINILSYYGNGDNYRQIDFGLRFAKECARCVVQGYIESPSLETLQHLVSRLSDSIYPLGGIEFATGVSALNDTLIERCPELYIPEQKMLKIEVCFTIVSTLNNTFFYDTTRQSIVGQMFGMHIIR